MEILMVQAPSVEDQSKERVYPLGLSILGGIAARAGHHVRIIDMNMEADGYDTILSALKAPLDLVCVSLRNIDPLANKNVSLVPPFVTLVSMIRSRLPKVKIIAGGTAFSLFPAELMNLAALDYGLVGEGERSFPRFLENIEAPDETIPGFCYYKQGELQINPPDHTVDLSQYCPPDHRLLSPLPYTKINQYVPAIGVETRRGCPLKCAYCSYPLLQGCKIRCRPVGEIVDEMEKLYRDFGVTYFHFNDPVVNMPVSHLDVICEEILDRGLKLSWTGFFRENLLTKENVDLYVRSGCNCFALSPDGLSEHALDVLQKDLTKEDILHAASLLADTGVCTLYHFMVNVPGETEETIAEGKALIDDIYEIYRKSRSIGTVVLNHIRLLPHTRSTADAAACGYLEKSDSLLYPLYFNPRPFQNLRYEMELQNQKKNTFMWYGIEE